MKWKAWFVGLLFVVLLVGLPWLVYDANQPPSPSTAIEDEDKTIPESTPLPRELFTIDDPQPEHDSQTLSDPVFLGAEETVLNFFGYLKAGEYENAATFFAPALFLDYFYADPSQRQDRIQAFGLTMTNQNRLLDVQIQRFIETGEFIEVTVELQFFIGDPQPVTFQIQTDHDLHDGQTVYWIHTPVDSILHQLNK